MLSHKLRVQDALLQKVKESPAFFYKKYVLRGGPMRDIDKAFFKVIARAKKEGKQLFLIKHKHRP